MSVASFGFGFGYEQGSGFGCQAQSDPCLMVEVDGVTFTGAAPVAPGFGLTAWGGWDNGGDAKGGPQDFPAADGGYETPVYFGPRTITLEGRIVARSQQELAEMIDQLSKVCTVSRWATMTVTEGKLGMQRQMRVCRLHRPNITPGESRRTAIFTLELQSAAYSKLDAQLSTLPCEVGGYVNAVNAGDYPADLTATIVGPLTNPTINVAGQRWSYMGTIADGQTLDIAFSTRLVRDANTGLGLRLWAGGEWPKLQPGTSSVGCTGTGAGTITLSWRSSWN